MKLMKRMAIMSMVIMMFLATPVTALASSTVTLTSLNSYSVVNGVKYQSYNVQGSTSGHTEKTHVLEFNPNDGYIPMAFSAYSGSCATLGKQYEIAVNKYGYEVVGVINGSYFDMTTGTLTGMLISGGKVSCADIGYTVGDKTEVVAFGYDGSMNIVNTQLAYKLYIDGTLVPDALRFFNKKQSSDGWRPDAVFYYDTSCGTVADSSTKGYEVICKKINGSDLTVGGALEAEVVEVKSNTCGSAFETDKYAVSDYFVLSTSSSSSYASKLKSLKAGTKIKISVEETVAESKEIMENASSVITNVGYLVKDGVDMTDKNSTIGTHSVSGTYAQWTAFGQKADGTYVFMTSEGGSTGDSSRSLTLKDVAAAMIKMGCVNVIRMDGGGSSGMYVSNTGSGSAGYMHTSSRAVADCILIVKNKPGKANLKTALNKAANVSVGDYSETTLSSIRAEYANASKVYANKSATDAQCQKAADTLNALLNKKDSEASKVKNSIYVTGFNASILGGDCIIFTSDFNNGSITAAAANHKWTRNVLLTWDTSQKAYVVTSTEQGAGNVQTINLKSNQILIAAHGNGGISTTNKEALAKAKVGQKLEIYAIDIDAEEIGIAAYLRFVDTGVTTETPDASTVTPNTPSIDSDNSTAKPNNSTGNTDKSGVTSGDTTETAEDATETLGDSTEISEDTTEALEDTTETLDDSTEIPDETQDDSNSTNKDVDNKDSENSYSYIFIVLLVIAVVLGILVVLWKKGIIKFKK